MLICIICLGVLYLILVVIIWRIWNKQEETIAKFHKQITEGKNKTNELRNTIDKLSSDCEMLKQRQQTVKTTVVYGRNEYSDATNQFSAFNNKQNKAVKEICYATLQAPDEHGRLRFSERSMSNNPTPEKMFILEIDPMRGTGIYRINPEAVSLILNDLQMFHDFVKPFSFSGNPMKATLKDKKEGRITKSGDFWIVDELLEITIK